MEDNERGSGDDDHRRIGPNSIRPPPAPLLRLLTEPTQSTSYSIGAVSERTVAR